jgi:6-phosphogluconolactonase (cycloisomerase 2 family)
LVPAIIPTPILNFVGQGGELSAIAEVEKRQGSARSTCLTHKKETTEMKSLSRSLAARLLYGVSLAVLVASIAACGGYGKQSATVVPASLAISPPTALQVVGATQQFTATVTFNDNSTRDVTAQTSWSSNAIATATITQQGGLESALAPGDATISASFTFGGSTVSASTVLRVTLPVLQSIAVEPASAELELGANQQFTATGTLPDGTTMDLTKFVSWSSSDQNVLRVNTTPARLGLGNTRGPGAAAVNAAANNVSGTTSVTVTRRIARFLYTAGVFGIQGYTISPATGALAPLDGSRFTAVGLISSLAVTRDRRFLYAADAALGVIWAFQIDASGALLPLPDSPFFTPTTSSPISVVAHPTADFLYMTDVNTGEITTFTIGSNGSLAASTLTTLVGHVPLLTAISPDGKFFYQGVRGTGTATIAGFAVRSNGRLSPIPGAPADTGFRPSMLTVDPSGSFLYATIPSSSLGASTLVFGYAIDPLDGILTPMAASPFNAGESPVSAATDASGRFLYVVNNADNTDGNSVSGFSIDAGTGALTNIPGTPFSAAASPLSLAVEPGAQFAYVGLALSPGMRAFAIDQQTGALTEITGSPFPADAGIQAMAVTY